MKAVTVHLANALNNMISIALKPQSNSMTFTNRV